MPETQTVTLEELKARGLINADGSFKGRAVVTAVKRSVCTACGGCFGKSPSPNVKECDCPDGWKGTETDLGVLLDVDQREEIKAKPGIVAQFVESFKESLA